MNKITVKGIHTHVCMGGGQNNLNPYKIREYKDKTIEILSRNRYVFL